MSDSNIYDADYFLRGKESGKSLYENYRWMPSLTIPMAERIVQHCGIKSNHRILDFGCARGYLVRAFHELGYEAYGIDISKWAIDNCDDLVKNYVYQDTRKREDSYHSPFPPIFEDEFDWIIAKDVLEHIEYVDFVIENLMKVAKVGLFIVVPLSKFPNSKYVIKEYEEDVTHVQRKPLNLWIQNMLNAGWSVEASYRVKGIKDNYAHHTYGNGFITARRVNE